MNKSLTNKKSMPCFLRLYHPLLNLYSRKMILLVKKKKKRVDA